MKIHTCYRADIRGQIKPNGRVGGVSTKLMKSTSCMCLSALKFCVHAFLERWDELKEATGVYRRRMGDVLIHSTAKSQAAYPEFDRLYANMPAHTRRAVVARALGIVSSYQSNMKRWLKSDPSERGRKPVLGIPNRYELTFYDQTRDVKELDQGLIRLNLFDGKAWNWFSFVLKPSDARYIAKLLKTRRMMSPVVDLIRGVYSIRFCFEEKRDLVPEDKMLDYRILAVDLGINSPASWCVMEKDGTVHARGVIHARAEEGRLNHALNKTRLYQSSRKKSSCVYRWEKNANRALSIATAKGILLAAEKYDVDCIVFEHLDMSGKKSGRRRMRLHHWRANDVQNRVELMAHRDGMRISRICAWGTSRLAFDGTGPVRRGKESYRTNDNYSLCEFTSGKLYNCDINAAYNIGARFFLREYAKEENCPPLPVTPKRTLATLWELVKAA